MLGDLAPALAAGRPGAADADSLVAALAARGTCAVTPPHGASAATPAPTTPCATPSARPWSTFFSPQATSPRGHAL
ncbi:MAG: hypothetical protein WKG07_37260 [Hymenobacter sp.]